MRTTAHQFRAQQITLDNKLHICTSFLKKGTYDNLYRFGNAGVAVITTVQKIVNTTGSEFLIRAMQSVLHNDGDRSEGFEGATTGIVIHDPSSFKGVTLQDRWGPCRATWMQQKNTMINVRSLFNSNRTLTLQIFMEATLFNTSIQPKQAQLVPMTSQDFFTLTPSSRNNYSINLTLAALDKKTPINQRFKPLTVGCSSPTLTFNLSLIATPTWQEMIFIPNGNPAFITLIPVVPGLPTQTDFVFMIDDLQEHPQSDGSSLETWQIALIAVGGGGVALLIVGGCAVIGVVVYYKHRKHRYQTLN